MQYQISSPSKILSKFVKNYWSLDNCDPTNAFHKQRIIPTGLFEISFYLGDKPLSKDKDRQFTSNTIISGQVANYYDLEVPGQFSIFSILFKPQGLSMFFDLPMQELYNQSLPLNYIQKDAVNELEYRLLSVKSFAHRKLIIEEYLMSLLITKQEDINFKRINHSIQLINRTSGLIDINRLATAACLSRKQFERIFSRTIGISPKKFLKIIRFQNAINIKSKNLNLNMTSLSYQSGYFDQSHLIHDFRKFAGMTPKKYFDSCEVYSDYFQ